MTQAVTPELLAVTQEDREAANALDDALGFLTADERPIVEQAFARHRLASASAPADLDGLKRIRTSMALLQQNSEGCALNHYGSDSGEYGMPGWLIDTKDDLDAFTAMLTAAPQPPVVDHKDAEIARLRSLLIDPGDPAWEDARGVLVAELRSIGFDTHADNVAAGEGVMIPSYVAMNLIGHARLAALATQSAEERMREALEKIADQDWWSAVDETDEVDGRCAEIARATLKEPRDDR